MKTVKITPPDGYEIDRAKSTLEEIVFKPIEPVKEKYPMSVKEVTDRGWYISRNKVEGTLSDDTRFDLENLKTRELASAFLALMQLKTICDEWNRIDGFVPDWINTKYALVPCSDEIIIQEFNRYSTALMFKDEATAQLFLDSFKEMIETAKPLL